MTNQEVFNKVIRHLRAQRIQALNGGQCAYRGENGAKCAVGCLIPDELYHPSMEGLLAGRDIMSELLQLLEIDVALADKLQELHDCYMCREWDDSSEFAAECIALEFGLKMPEVEL